MRHGKREMRKNYTPFLAGMATMVLLIGLFSPPSPRTATPRTRPPAGRSPPRSAWAFS